MKKVFFVLCSFLFFISVVNASILPSVYVGTKFGTTLSNKDKKKILDTDFTGIKINSKSAPSASVNVGVGILGLRLEAEYLYQYHLQTIRINYNDKHISRSVAMGNIYYDLLDLYFIKLFIGGGLGKADYRTNLIQFDNSTVWNVGAGVTFNMFNIFALDLGYRYLGTQKLKINKAKLNELYEFKSENFITIRKDKYNFNSNNLYIGIRVGF